MQTPVALLVENVNVLRPLEAVAVSVIGDTPMATVETGANVTVWIAVPIPAGWLIEGKAVSSVAARTPKRRNPMADTFTAATPDPPQYSESAEF